MTDALCDTLWLAGVIEIEKSFATGVETVTEAVAVCVPEVAEPVTVNVELPDAVVLALSVSVELWPAVTDAGLKEPVTPDGRPLTESETVCALPLVTAVLTVNEVLLPWATVALEGVTETEKSFAGGGVLPLSATSSYSV